MLRSSSTVRRTRSRGGGGALPSDPATNSAQKGAEASAEGEGGFWVPGGGAADAWEAARRAAISGLYCTQLTLGYFLMLVAMTYQVRETMAESWAHDVSEPHHCFGPIVLQSHCCTSH